VLGELDIVEAEGSQLVDEKARQVELLGAAGIRP